MILPEKVQGRHKIRDAKICRLFIEDNLTYLEIGKQFNLTEPRISKILYNNRALLILDKEYEKAKRIVHLKRLLAKYPDTIAKKSTIDITDMLRKETEGDKPLIDASHNHTINIQIQKTTDEDFDRTKNLIEDRINKTQEK